MSRSGRRNVQAAIAGARVVESEAPERFSHLPPGCPVTALGCNGPDCFYINTSGQLVALSAEKHTRLGILNLFKERSDFLHEHWPRVTKDGTREGWRPERGAEALMNECGAQGIWNPRDRARGRGAWPGARGELVLHTGRQIRVFAPNQGAWRDQVVHKPGLHGRHVYIADEQAGEPADPPVPGAAAQLLEVLAGWAWRRPEIDPVLMLGWTGAAMIGGALEWRPIAWLTGGKGTGKSTLQTLLDGVFGGSLLKLAEATEAHVRQTLQHQTLPVMLDEAEAEEDNRKLQAIVRLARIAASGGTLGRGGADHKAVEFTLRGGFMFGSILLPPLLPQDRSRIAVLELGRLAAGSRTPNVDAAIWAPIGAQLRRRLVDNWWRWVPTLAWYRERLSDGARSKRAQDVYGTLLAAADLLLFDGAPDSETGGETGGEWVRLLSEQRASDKDGEHDDERDCIEHLLGQVLEPYRSGARKTVAEWIRIAATWDAGDVGEAAHVLQTVGLKLRVIEGGMQLAVAQNHPGLARLFAETRWAARGGGTGVWVQALLRLDGGDRLGAVWFAGVVSRAVALPLASVLTRRDVDPPLPGQSEPPLI